MDYSYFFYHRTLVIICFLAQLHLFIDGLFIFLLSQNFGYYMFSCSASLIYRWTIHISFITELWLLYVFFSFITAQLHLFIDGLFIFLLSQNFGYYMFSCSASLIYRWTIHISFITELWLLYVFLLSFTYL